MLRPCRLVQSDYRPVRQRGTRPRHLYFPAGEGGSAVGAGSGRVAGAGCSLVSLARANRRPDSTDERGGSCPSMAQEDTLGKASCIAAFSGAYLGPFQFFSGRHDQMCLPTQAGGLLSPLSCPVRFEEQTRFGFWRARCGTLLQSPGYGTIGAR